MGTHCTFTCCGCGYAEDISGGEDLGMFARTRTAVCPACRRLVDVVVAFNESHLSRYPEERGKLDRCPHCGGTELALLAESPEAIACPRCGKPMRKGAISAFWD